jgi:hypothetical protein
MDMNLIDIAVALSAGLVLAFIASRFSSGGSVVSEAVDRVVRLGRMRAQGMDAAAPGEETFTVTKGMIEEALKAHTKPAKFAWASNFLWFMAGTIVSIFTSEIRMGMGLG